MGSSIKCLVYKDCDTDLVSVVLRHKKSYYCIVVADLELAI